MSEDQQKSLKSIINLAASHFAENGYQHMNSIKAREKYPFLNEDDPDHEYFMQQLKRCEDAKALVPVNCDLVPLGQEKFKIAEKAKKPPPEFEFLVDPPSISAFDLEFIQATALYVARNGRVAQTNLASKQSKDFDFLRPQHSHHVYFTKLVEQYMKILMPSRMMLLSLDEGINDPDKFYNDALCRADWIKHQQSSKSNEEDEMEKEKLARKQIDWSFDNPILVDLFNTKSYEPFVKREDVGSWCIEQIRGKSNSVNKIRIVEDSVRGADTEIQDMEEENDVEEFKLPTLPKKPQGDQIIVKQNYDPKARKRVETNQHMFVSPLTNEIVSEDNLTDHLKKNLIASTWLENKNRSIRERQEQDEVYARGENIKNSLDDFAKHRSDIFGGKTQIEEKTEKKENIKPQWDGHSSSADKIRQLTKGTINEQIADIHKNNGLLHDESKERIGPSRPANFPIPNQNYNPQVSMRPPPVSQLPPVYSQMYMPIQPTPSFGSGFQGQMQMVHPRPAFEAEDEPPAKKSKQENGLIPENEFLANHPYPVTFHIQVPNVEDSKMRGQVIAVELHLSDQVSVLKAKICSEVGMPPGKQKLQIGSMFLKDGNTLAYYNVDNNTVVSLQTKERGGRKK